MIGGASLGRDAKSKRVRAEEPRAPAERRDETPGLSAVHEHQSRCIARPTASSANSPSLPTCSDPCDRRRHDPVLPRLLQGCECRGASGKLAEAPVSRRPRQVPRVSRMISGRARGRILPSSIGSRYPAFASRHVSRRRGPNRGRATPTSRAAFGSAPPRASKASASSSISPTESWSPTRRGGLGELVSAAGSRSVVPHVRLASVGHRALAARSRTLCPFPGHSGVGRCASPKARGRKWTHDSREQACFASVRVEYGGGG